ncbi:MAG: cysteine--tRNA ligase [Candidatus Delongbacteria bacterium]|nr:cysteine--tRNA ligase [Candidatus Delongbacteria bacterium]
MALRFYNSMTRKKEEFISLQEGKAGLYTCGPTVYGYAHIGNFRAYMFEDLLRRYLKYSGYEVTQVMNLTDVDDKTIRRSQEEGLPLQEFTLRFKDAFFNDLKTLKIEAAEHYPAATDHIPEMVELVQRLQANGNTYDTGGSIYFSIASFPEYGRLANLDPESMRACGRIDNDEYEKDDARDFALWKAWTDGDGDVFWETVLGKGRPGWHIECSAMSTRYLGTNFDLHTGGVDNRFPHHENEIAQSVCGYKDKFVKYWLHCEFLLVDGRKMSKSLGNFHTIPQLLEMGLDPLAIRYALLSVHYRMKLNFTIDGVKAAAQSVQRLQNFYKALCRVAGQDVTDEAGTDGLVMQLLQNTADTFREALDDDLNIAPALGAVFTLLPEINRLQDENRLSSRSAARVRNLLDRVDSVLGVIIQEEECNSEIEQLMEERQAARTAKDWAEADRIRDRIQDLGYVIEDSPEGPRYYRKKC